MKSRGRAGLPARYRGGIYVLRQWVLRRGVWYWQEWCEARLQFYDRSRSLCRSWSFKRHGEAAAMRYAKRQLKEWRRELEAGRISAIEPAKKEKIHAV